MLESVRGNKSVNKKLAGCWLLFIVVVEDEDEVGGRKVEQEGEGEKSGKK